MPHAAIGADVMTGFPGETDQELEETIRFVENQPLTYLHVFTYSERPGTAAASMPDAVPIDIRRERTRVLRELSDNKNRAFRQRMVGQTLSAVTLEQQGIALTTNFLRVEMATISGANQIVDLEIGGISKSGLRERAAFPIL